MRGRYILMLILPMCWAGCDDDSRPADTDPPFVRLVTGQKLASGILHRAIRYAVLLPEGYDQSEETYPVVYLLHGYGDDEEAWYTGGGLQFYVDQNSAETVPMIYVMPEGFNTYYIDRYNGNYPYMKMFVTELVPAIDEKFRTKADKTQRAVMGYSMGGYGALILPAMHPDVFTISVPLSMSFRTDEQYLAETQGAFDVQWAPNFGPYTGASGEDRLSAYFMERSPFHFFNSGNTGAFSGLKILLDCGDDEESLSETNDALHVLMRENNIAHEYRVRSGGHSWDYWKKSYPEALRYISDAVQGIEYAAEPDPVDIGTPVQSNEYETVVLPETELSIHIITPADYAATTAEYPVVYFLHQHEEGKRTGNVTDVFSLMRNAVSQGKLYKSIAVEIPVNEADIDLQTMKNIMTYTEATYRTEDSKESRILLGNGAGGDNVLSLVNEDPALAGSCFLFNAFLDEGSAGAVQGVFYHLDISDEASACRAYHILYRQIRKAGIEYEYRVRQGTGTYQSFLNGLSESLPVLKDAMR